MNIPEEFSGRVCKTRMNPLVGNLKSLYEIVKAWPGSEVDVIYENGKSIVVVVFESQEDCLAFKLKHGDNYV